MAIANTRKAIEFAEASKIPSFASGGKVKGYRVYGTISEYALKDIELFKEKEKASGFFALFYPAFYQRLESTPGSMDVFNIVLEEMNRRQPEGSQKHLLSEDGVYYANGSALVYIDNENLLGEKVVFELSRKTSLSRCQRDHNKTVILAWEKKQGTKEWQIVPLRQSKCEILRESLIKKYRMEKYITDDQPIKSVQNRINKQAKSETAFDDDRDKLKPLKFVTMRGDDSSAYLKSEWVMGTPVSSVNKRVSIEANDRVNLQWKNTTKIDARVGVKPDSLVKLDKKISKYEDIFKSYMTKLKTDTENFILKESHENNRLNYTANTIINNYIKKMLNNWNTPIGEDGIRGKQHISVLLDYMDEIGFSDEAYELRVFIGKNIADYHNMDACYYQFTNKKLKQKIGSYLYAGLVVTETTNPSMIPKLYRNYLRVQKEHNLSDKAWFMFFISNPYALALLGAGLKYDDCLEIESTLYTDLYWSDAIANKDDCKEMLYILTLYRNYTRDSGYHDTLVSIGELHNKDVRAELAKVETIENKLASCIWGSGGLLSFGNKVYTVPKVFERDETVFNMPDLLSGKYKIPYRKNKEPIEGLFAKMGIQGNGMMYKNITQSGRKLYMPTYEARMEVDFMNWLFETNNGFKPLDLEEIKQVAQNFSADVSQNQLKCATLSGYRTALIAGSVVHNTNEGADKLDNTLDFFIYVLTELLHEEVVLVGEDFIPVCSKVKHIHKPPYVEPTYVYSTSENLPLFDNPVTYIVEDVNDYSLWDLQTFISSLKPSDKLFFIGDLSKKNPRKGVATIHVMQSILPYANMGISLDVFTDKGSTYSNVPYYQSLLSYGSDDFKCKTKQTRLIKADTNEEIEEVIKTIIRKSTQGVTPEENIGYVQNIVKEPKSTFTINDIGVISSDSNLDYEHLFALTTTPAYRINKQQYYIGDRLVYEGITDSIQARFEYDERECVFKEVETKGISKHHEVTLFSVAKWKDIKIKDNKRFKNKLGGQQALIVSFKDSLLQKDIYMFFDCKVVNGYMYGHASKLFKKAFTYPITNLPARQKQVQVIVLPKDKTVSMQELYSAITTASKHVYFVGSVTGQKSVFEQSREIREQKWGKTLLKRARKVQRVYSNG